MVEKKNLKDNLIFGLIVALIFIGTLWKGYYGESLKTVITFILGLIMVLYFSMHLKSPLWLDKINLLAIFYLLANIVSLFTAINLRAALGETFLIICYIFVFYYFRRTSEGKVLLFLATIYTAATLVALLGIANFGGLVNLQGGLYYGKRLQSTLQYANTTAIFLLINYLMGIFILSLKKLKAIIQYLITTSSAVLALAILLTYSRGVFLLSIPLLILLLLLYCKEIRTKIFLNLFMTLTPSILLIQLYIYLLKYNLTALAWVTFFAMMGLAALGRYLFAKNWLSVAKPNNQAGGFNKKILLPMVFMGLAFLALGIYLDNPVIERVKTIVTKTSSLKARIEIYQDALKIIKDHPVLGVGEKGWESLYPSYQTKPYIANEVHSQLLKAGVNAGIPGMLFYAGFWLYCFYYLFSKVKKHNLLGFILVATMGLMVHSLFDFNLSLPAIALITWSLIGAGVNLADKTILDFAAHRDDKRGPYILKTTKRANYSLLILALVLCLSSGSFYLGYLEGEKGLSLVNQKAQNLGIQSLELATTLDPLGPRYHLALAKIYETQRPLDKAKTFRQYKKAYILAPYSFEIIANFGQFLINIGQIQEGISLLDKLPKLRPLQYDYYPSLVGNYLRGADYFIKTKNYKQALSCFREIINLYYQPKKPQALFKPEVYFVLAQARYYNSQYPEASEALKASIKGKKRLPAEVLMWQALILEKLHETKEAQAILVSLKASQPELIKVYDYIRLQKALMEQETKNS